MKKLLVVENLLVIFIATLLTWVITAFIYQNILVSAKESEIENMMKFAARMNVTDISGNVGTYNIEIEKEEKDYPEVIAAKKFGFGKRVENYGIFGVSRVYAAAKLGNGKIIRAVSTVPQGMFTFWSIFPPLILVAFFSINMATHLINNLKFVIKSAEMTIERAGNEGGIEVRPAPEMLEYADFVKPAEELAKTSTQISKKIRELFVENKRIEYLFNNMNEGLVAVRKDFSILLINRSAERFFNAEAGMKGRNILHLTHIPAVEKTLKGVFESGESSVLDVKSPDGKKTLQIIVSSILDDDTKEISGAIMLISDVTEIRLAEQIRSEFVANASHELKTPLTTIKGFSELIDTGIVSDPEKARGYLCHIRTETERMISLIGDILKLSELEATPRGTGIAEVSLRLIAQKVKNSLVNQIGEKGVEVTIDGDVGSFKANPDHMQQMLTNLIDNAIKYNKPGGKINVTVAQGLGEVAVTVSDTGVGIPKESQGRVFERFYRVDKSRSRKIGGTGLGLSIVKHIVELYDGTIELQSEEGNGTSITIRFPVEANE